jgi:hypothetical protein
MEVRHSITGVRIARSIEMAELWRGISMGSDVGTLPISESIG